MDDKRFRLICFIAWAYGVFCAPLLDVFREMCEYAFQKYIMEALFGPKGSIVGDQEIEESSVDDDEVKLVLCVRTDLEMGKGKIAAQCGHATLGAYMESVDSNNPYLDAWMNNGQKKIVLKLKGYEAMLAVKRAAQEVKVNCHITSDAGRTQIPAGSHTVIAIGPAPGDIVNQITGHLKLL